MSWLLSHPQHLRNAPVYLTISSRIVGLAGIAALRPRLLRSIRVGESSCDMDVPCDLSVALPIGLLISDYRVVHRRLHVAGTIDGA